jgi:DnaJ-class molecular chaperone
MAAPRISPWIICPTCMGEGKSSRHLGVIDCDEWDADEFADYLEGAYDQTCTTCNGTGKVREGEGYERHERTLRAERYLERGLNADGEPI